MRFVNFLNREVRRPKSTGSPLPALIPVIVCEGWEGLSATRASSRRIRHPAFSNSETQPQIQANTSSRNLLVCSGRWVIYDGRPLVVPTRCSKCGTNNPSNNFCPKCGSALANLCAKCKAQNPPHPTSAASAVPISQMFRTGQSQPRRCKGSAPMCASRRSVGHRKRSRASARRSRRCSRHQGLDGTDRGWS
jgi:hypothetical protein